MTSTGSAAASIEPSFYDDRAASRPATAYIYPQHADILTDLTVRTYDRMARSGISFSTRAVTQRR